MIVVTGIPLYQQLILHQRSPVLPFFLPFTSPDTVFGFYINHANHMFFGLLGYPAFLGFEFVVQMLKNTTWAQSMAISYNLKELQLANDESTINEMELKLRIREIMAEVCDSDNFLVDFSDIYYWKFFLGPFLLTYSVGMGLFLFYVVISISIFVMLKFFSEILFIDGMVAGAAFHFGRIHTFIAHSLNSSIVLRLIEITLL